MNRSFWRPLLIFALAALLLALAGPLLPGLDNPVFPLRRFDLAASLASLWKSAPADSLAPAGQEPALPSEIRPLRGFWSELTSLGASGNLRIAHFGDSIIEGDLITSSLLRQFQAQYGGSGVGLVPIASIVSGFRQTIRHNFSRNWETLSFMSGAGRQPLGMIGYTFIPRPYYYEEQVIETQSRPEVLDSLGNVVSPAQEASSRKERRRFSHSGPAWVEYGGTQTPGGAASFKRVRLFYSHASAGSQLLVSHDGGEYKSVMLTPGDSLRVVDLSAAGPIRKIRLQFDPHDPIHLYGVSLDEPAGVYVDNLAVRGFTGLNFAAIPSGLLREFQRQLDYDLVILQYGGNVSNPDTRDYNYYHKGMLATVRHLQAALPGVPILLVSVHDRGVKSGGSVQTSPDIPLLVNVQAEVARETGCAFWNLFEAMGGQNSMLAYVRANPPLAGKDYTHFTRAGADKVASMLHQLLARGQ